MAVPSTRLLVLAMVRLLQPVHGYDVRRELLSWRADQWASIAQGSIYSALRTLQRDGLIDVDGVGQDGARPERTQYRISPEGELEFHSLLRETLRSIDQPKFPYMPAAVLFPFADRAEVIAALQSRIAKLEVDAEFMNSEVRRVLAGSGDPIEAEPYHVADANRFLALHLEADLQWSRETLARIEKGELDVWTDSRIAPFTRD